MTYDEVSSILGDLGENRRSPAACVRNGMGVQDLSTETHGTANLQKHH